MNKNMAKKIEDLANNTLSADDLKKIRRSLEADSEAWELYFGDIEHSERLIPDDLMDAYYSVCYDKDQSAHPSFISKWVYFFKFKAKQFDKNFSQLNHFVKGIGVAAAVCILLVFTMGGPENEESPGRTKGGVSSLFIPHKLALHLLNSDGTLDLLKRTDSINSGSTLLFSIRAKRSGYLYLATVSDERVAGFYPINSDIHSFSVEDNNTPVRAAQGLVSYILEKEAPITFCSILSDSPELTDEELSRAFKENHTVFEEGNCKTIQNIRG